MYGMVNRAVEDMVCLHHGEAIWEQMKARAGVEVEVFLSNEAYPDELTYRLIAAGSAVLGQPTEKILEAFGEHWVLHTAREGYGDLLRAAGKSLPEFLRNLPDFHRRVAMIFTGLQPPWFQTTDRTDGSLELHYFTQRHGFTPFVIGLLQGLAKMYETPVKVLLLESKAKGADHDVFRIEWGSSGVP